MTSYEPIYHLVPARYYEAQPAAHPYLPDSFEEEGFIHCSQENQVAGVLERYFSEKTGLVKLVIDTDKLSSRFVFDWSPSSRDTFPHIYGPINLDAVVDVVAI